MKKIIHPNNFLQRVLRRALIGAIITVIGLVLQALTDDEEKKKDIRNTTEGLKALFSVGVLVHWFINRKGK